MSVIRLSLALLSCCLLTAAAQAQSRAQAPYAPRHIYRSSYRPPLTSPYLNMLREDVSPAINYHALVKPQLQQEYVNARGKSNVATMRNELSAEEQARDPRAGSQNVRSTGHRGRFMDYSNYYFREPGQ